MSRATHWINDCSHELDPPSARRAALAVAVLVVLVAGAVTAFGVGSEPPPMAPATAPIGR